MTRTAASPITASARAVRELARADDVAQVDREPDEHESEQGGGSPSCARAKSDHRAGSMPTSPAASGGGRGAGSYLSRRRYAAATMTANEMPSGASGEPVHLRRPTLDDERLRLALEAGAMGTWAWDVASAKVTWDTAMEARYGLAPGTFPGTFDAFIRLVHPNDVDAARRRIESALRAGEDLRYEHRVVWPNGEVHWLEGRGRVVHDADGTPVAMVGIGMDIDQRKASEAAIAEAVRLRTEHARSAIQVLQETLVPADFPDVRGYRLAGRYMAAESEHNIGGDWYDAFAVDERRVLVSVGDVSGHGLLAGRTMAKMRHAARAFACEDPDPGSVVTRLDNFFRHLRRGDEIVTVLVGLLDTERHTLELYSAGHVPPLVLATAPRRSSTSTCARPSASRRTCGPHVGGRPQRGYDRAPLHRRPGRTPG